MDEGLSGQIEARKAQARDRDIRGMAKRIAYFLGTGNRDRRDSQGSYTNMVYTGYSLTIVYTATAHHNSHDEEPLETVEVQCDGETVFQQRGPVVDGYVPGEWEMILKFLLPLAARSEESMTQEKEKAARNAESEKSDQLRRAWGISAGNDRGRGNVDPRKPEPGGPLDRPAGGSR